MQIVYLSNRPLVLRETWQHVRHFMPWVDRAIVVAPRAAHHQFDLGDGVELVADEDLASADGPSLASLDHVRRNVTLRRAVIAGGLVDDVFLLSDDDYRPIRPIDEVFFTSGGRDTGYYSYELAQWPGFETDFDQAQHVTHDALAYLGLPHLAYGAHMPQIMRRDLWEEAFELFGTVSDDTMVDEWSLYFNVSQRAHPERFDEPRPFETMCWPQFGAEWPWWVRPARWSFENFYPDMYEPGHLFDGLPSRLDADRATKVNFDKITRWTNFARAAERLDFPADVENPWIKGSPLRRAYFAALRPARKTFRYIAESRTPHDDH